MDFQRWTLQELLAPPEMRFYDCDWTYFGTKSSLAHDIESVTRINVDYFKGVKHFRKACIATKMSWMAGRTTSRIEDLAYSTHAGLVRYHDGSSIR